MMGTQTLQNFIYPADITVGSKEKYLRIEGSVYWEGSSLNLQKYSSVQFDTYYNAFSTFLWKNKVGINEIALEVKGSGKVKIELCLLSQSRVDAKRVEHSIQLLDTNVVELGNDRSIVCHINQNNLAVNGLLYPKITALSDVRIDSLSWQTPDDARRAVKLGISITHFNRKSYVIPAIKRIKENLLDDANWAERIDFLVVDNSQNLTSEEAQGVRVIPNENTGGSGGFTRGFLHYKNETDATHVLFMDDDASLEVESIKRTYAILSFAEEENSAVGAALFYEDKPDMLIERGAQLNNTWVQAAFHDKKIIEADDVLLSEMEPSSQRTYMGWWFCAFPISYTQRMTPPYFVRGDDASFTQPGMNKYTIIYGNGIACYAEGFLNKVAPLTTYLDTINPIVVNALFTNHFLKSFTLYARRYLSTLFSVRYGYVDVMRMGMKDFCNLNVDNFTDAERINRLFPKFKQLTEDESLKEMLQKQDSEESGGLDEGRFGKILRAITLNKQLLPLKKGTVIKQEFMYRAILRQVAGYKTILYYDDKERTGFYVTTKRNQTLKYLLFLIGDFFKLAIAYPRVRRHLLKNFDYLTSEEMWKKILKLES